MITAPTPSAGTIFPCLAVVKAFLSPAMNKPISTIGTNRDTLSLWLARPAVADDLAVPFESLLSSDERVRLEHIRFLRDRREYLAAHALVRIALSHFHPTAPAAWRFRRSAHGKPVTDPECGLHFNIAHASGLTVCLISQQSEVGIDVEPLGRGAEILEIAKTVFSPSELAQIDSMNNLERADHALTLWTLKEAFVKWNGQGLSMPLKTISFLRHKTKGLELHLDSQQDLHTPARHRFSIFDILEHRIAIVVESSGDPRTELWEIAQSVDSPRPLVGIRAVFYPRAPGPP